MAKLSKKASKQISVLINSIQCAGIMQRDASAEKNYNDAEYWRVQESIASVYLADTYGIELATLKNDRINVLKTVRLTREIAAEKC